MVNSSSILLHTTMEILTAIVMLWLLKVTVAIIKLVEYVKNKR